MAKLSRSGLNFENAFEFEVINKTAVKFKFADSETVYYVKDSVIYTDAACTENTFWLWMPTAIRPTA